MARRFVGLIAAAVLGVVLGYPQYAAAQKSAGPDLGQQGEFNGEHVDTGAAALDTGPEATEIAEGVEAMKSIKASTSTLRTTVAKTTTARTSVSSVRSPGSSQDLDIEGNFDLQEIAGVDVPEVR